MKHKHLNAVAMLIAAVVGGAVIVGCATQESEAGSPDSTVAAEVGGKKITMDEVDAAAKAKNMKPYQALYDARRAALDELVAEKLYEAEAASRGMSKEELIEQEITQKSPAVTDADIEKFFNENKARMGGRSMEQVTGQIREYLVGENRKSATDALVATIKSKNAVRVLLDPPRTEVKVASNDPRKGTKNAAIQIVEFSEFQ
ncbi:MAG: hypothetical protein GY716_14270 [bacterium]|nr:hypothetical protein [bacterium]